MSQITSPSIHIAGAGVWQAIGQIDPSGMQKSPIQQPSNVPMSQLISVVEQFEGMGGLQTVGTGLGPVAGAAGGHSDP